MCRVNWWSTTQRLSDDDDGDDDDNCTRVNIFSSRHSVSAQPNRPHIYLNNYSNTAISFTKTDIFLPLH